jgi:hypothetical protein
MARPAKLAVVFVSLLAGVLLLAGSALPASAHGSHHRAPPAAVTVAVAVAGPAHEAGAADSGAAQAGLGTRAAHLAPSSIAAASDQPGPQQDQGHNSCCCGGVLCHAGVATAAATTAFAYTAGERVALPSVLAIARDVPGGIERPPRAAGRR